MFLAITSVGWGFNWPVTKYLLSELPPLTLRGSSGVIGAALLALLALLSRQSLHVPRWMWPRIVLLGVLNVTAWMVLMGLALLWLPASEAALIAYTMPVWASLLAWPVLGERPTLSRTIALVMAFAGLASIMGGNGLSASVQKLPGIIMALCGAIGFAVGTVLAKRRPILLPPIPAAAWQIGIGCLPVAIADQDYVRAYADEVRAQRSRLQLQLADWGLRYWPSQANFVLLEIGPSHRAFVDAMRDRGILVRDRSSDPGCDGCVRITLGLRDQADRLIKTMQEVLTELGLLRERIAQ